MKIYLAGAMRGLPNHNFTLFNQISALLRHAGHEVFNPAEQNEALGLTPDKVETDLTDKNQHDLGKSLAFFMELDLPAVCRSEAVAVIPGWENALGANLEIHVARICKIPVLDALTLQPLTTPNMWGI